MATSTTKPSVVEVASVFTRLGFTAFGGPVAHIALMEDEFVERRQWLSHDEFADMLAAANLVPGPTSTELALHIGMKRAGLAGLLAAGLGFILPAALMVAALAWAYLRYGGLPQLQGLLIGIKPVVLAIIAVAIVRLVAKSVDTWPKRGVLVASLGLAFLSVSEAAVLFGAGAVLAVARLREPEARRSFAPLGLLLALIGAVALVPFLIRLGQSGPGTSDAAGLFLYFLQIGALLYGSGYVLYAFMERDLVAGAKWISPEWLVASVAVGQFTPGPLFTTATFIGYLLGGPMGALTATVGIFLPAFLFVGLIGPLLPRLRASAVTASFLDGVNAAALALMAAVTWRLGLEAVNGIASGILGLAALVVLLRTKLNPAWLILVGAGAGLAMQALELR